MDERENLRAMSKDDNLELSFAAQNGNYLGGAKVLVKTAGGKEKPIPMARCFLPGFQQDNT